MILTIVPLLKRIEDRISDRRKAKELTCFLLGTLAPNGLAYESLSKDGVRIRTDNPFINICTNQDLHGSLVRVRQYGLCKKSCLSSYGNPEGFCNDCYFGYRDIDGDSNCSLDISVARLMGTSPYGEVISKKFVIADQYCGELRGKQPTPKQSLRLLKCILFRFWKDKIL